MGNLCGNFASEDPVPRNRISKLKRSSKATSTNLGSSIPTSKVDVSSAISLKSFSLDDLKIATKDFSWNSFLGEGTLGVVYKGWIDRKTFAPTRPGVGTAVAVKKQKLGSLQGHKEWLSEITYLGQFHHENLIKLVGYCSEFNSKLLVYEYMQRGSLDNHLFRGGAQLVSWTVRVKIAIDVSRALSFLHSLETPVIYRNLKASDVLLDSDFKAKLSDFGLARNGPTGDETHVSTRVVATCGYVAPEYLATGHLTVKCDVYNYGILLLELLSGRKAQSFYTEKRKIKMDARLEDQCSKKEARAIYVLALQCSDGDPRKRPNMTEVLTTLEGLHKSEAMPLPRVDHSRNQNL
ncbi:probable serine/threonine-protein kinase PBL11 isoform X1 [Typha angustifolia]|uniref:probable serine/threonine-protein kinase PBL11 isoform X1 n=1 Tax=Typha angustifolia TaxID=59011 RepID=UPI003C2F8114